jgi:hypothetical protein
MYFLLGRQPELASPKAKHKLSWLGGEAVLLGGGVEHYALALCSSRLRPRLDEYFAPTAPR